MRQPSPNRDNQNNSNVVSVVVDKAKGQRDTKQNKMKQYYDNLKQDQSKVQEYFINHQQSQVDKDKQIESNKKLKQQIKELVIYLDNIVKGQKQKKLKEKQEKIMKNKGMEDHRIQFGQQMKQIQDNIKEIAAKSKQIESIEAVNNTKDKENEEKYLLQKLNDLKDKRKAQKKVSQLQDEGVKQTDYQQIENDIKRIKEQIGAEQILHRQLVDQLNKIDKDTIVKHTELVTKQKAIKSIEQKIKDKQNTKKEDPVSDQKISELLKEIKELDESKVQLEADYSSKLKKLEEEKQKLKQQVDKKLIEYRQIERSYKIEMLKNHEGNRYNRMDDKQSTIRSSKPNLSVQRKKSITNRVESPKSEKSKHESVPIKDIEPIKEEQFEETIAIQDQKPKKQSAQKIKRSDSEQFVEEEVIEETEQIHTQEPPQQEQRYFTNIFFPSIFKKPTFLLKKK